MSVAEFAARHDISDEDAIDRMRSVAAAMVRKRLGNREPIAG